MSETQPPTARIRFSDFEVDLDSRELFRNGALVRLPNQSFLALAVLLDRPGQLVTREELRLRLWPDRRVVEFEQGLNAIINRLREALGDSAEEPRFIETLPRRGYRFIGTPASADTAPAATAAATTGIADARTPRVSRTIAATAIAVAATAVALALSHQSLLHI
jgi:DNA-binding winged helix-turn-helix (wHTH) protein